MNKQAIINGLKDFDKEHATSFAEYIYQLSIEKKKDGSLKNGWVKQLADDYVIQCFKNVAIDGLVFDGKHITLQRTGISYDYIAYKNKMLLAYPNSLIDIDLVYEGDDFTFKKESGKVYYTHNILEPFKRQENEIIGGYCVIKNSRGEFLTLLSKKDIDKHRSIAKTDYIWKAWFVEMAKKTVIKKACKFHFEDIYNNINTLDNENYDVDLPLDIDSAIKGKIEEFDDVKKLGEYYNSIKDDYKGDMRKSLNMLVAKKKEELENGTA